METNMNMRSNNLGIQNCRLHSNREQHLIIKKECGIRLSPALEFVRKSNANIKDKQQI